MKAFAAIFLTVGLALFAGAGYFVNNTLDFVDSSTEASATVVSLAASRNQGAGKSPSYRPVYSFKVDGQEVTAESSGAYTSPAPKVGDEHAVRYKTDDPQDVRKDSLFGLWLGPIILTPIGLVFFLIGLWALVRSRGAGKTQAKAEELMATGGCAVGTVLDIREGKVRVSTGGSNRRVRVVMRMRIEPLDGSPAFEGEKKIFIELVGAPQKGARYPVFYDPADTSVWCYIMSVPDEAARTLVLDKFGGAFGDDASGVGMIGVQSLTAV